MAAIGTTQKLVIQQLYRLGFAQSIVMEEIGCSRSRSFVDAWNEGKKLYTLPEPSTLRHLRLAKFVELCCSRPLSESDRLLYRILKKKLGLEQIDIFFGNICDYAAHTARLNAPPESRRYEALLYMTRRLAYEGPPNYWADLASRKVSDFGTIDVHLDMICFVDSFYRRRTCIAWPANGTPVIERLIDSLPGNDMRKEVFRARFGLGREKSETYEELGARFDITKERVRQIEAKMLRHLRQGWRGELIERMFFQTLGELSTPLTDQQVDAVFMANAAVAT